MKTLMKKVGGCKKARFWNMAKFQTRRWHREQAQAAAAKIEPNVAKLAPATHERPSAAMAIPSPACPPEHRAAAEGEGWCPSGRTEGGLSASSSRPSIQESNNRPIQPLVNPPILPSSNLSSSSVSSVKSVVETPPLSSPLPPVKHSDLRNSFVALRANGWSLRSISQKLGVPKSTLFNWESDRETRRTIDVMKCLQVERLQERYLPSFEEELQKLSTCLSRIERALEKQDFEKMKPEFLLRTFLQLRSRLNGLRRDVHPTDTLNHGPSPEIIRGCISHSDHTTDCDADSVPSPGGEGQGEGGLSGSTPSSQLPSGKDSSSDSASPPDTKWDKNQNSSLSQPSVPTTSSEKVGTPVPAPLVVPASAGPTSDPNQVEYIVLTAGFHPNRPPAGNFAKTGLPARGASSPPPVQA